jgi:hypothetical protein
MDEPTFRTLASPTARSSHSTSDALFCQEQPSSPRAPTVAISKHDYNFSNTTYDGSSATDEHDDYTDEEIGRLKAETVSSRSSISSLPASVAASAMVLPPDAITPTKSPNFNNVRRANLSRDLPARPSRNSPFRNASSVLSMQMRDEDDIISHHRKRNSRTSRNPSAFSAMSAGSVTRHRSDRDSRTSAKSPKVKKEFPLVLLHCSLLAPTMPTKAGVSDAAILQAVVPDLYWKRWKLLNDKITESFEIQSRGILIPHPKGDYDLLEERLLESLELAKPRLRSGHFYGNENFEEGEESESDAETADQGAKCQDCGRKVVQDVSQDRKWEVKVYAANGLMRAGAWSAAWNEMEKVDVEVSVWLPEGVRCEVEERLSTIGIGRDVEPGDQYNQETTEAERRRREIYGTTESDSQEKTDGLYDPGTSFDYTYGDELPHGIRHRSEPPRHPYVPVIELKHLVVNYARGLARDKRNLMILILSLVVLFFAKSASDASRVKLGRNVVTREISEPTIQLVPQCTPVISTSESVLAAVPAAESTLAEIDRRMRLDHHEPSTSPDGISVCLPSRSSQSPDPTETVEDRDDRSLKP